MEPLSQFPMLLTGRGPIEQFLDSATENQQRPWKRHALMIDELVYLSRLGLVVEDKGPPEARGVLDSDRLVGGPAGEDDPVDPLGLQQVRGDVLVVPLLVVGWLDTARH